MIRETCQLLSGGQLVRADSIRREDILIRGGKILRIEDRIRDIPSGCRHIDCAGKLIFPGIIDTHVHLKDAATESRAALRGGVTAIMDFSRHEKGKSLLESVRQRKAELAGC
ncbi:MAG: hypothetical protein GXO91_02135, partial [FCB group bacterium]|nr:hypothetical protein [FCB group bacterium]